MPKPKPFDPDRCLKAALHAVVFLLVLGILDATLSPYLGVVTRLEDIETPVTYLAILYVLGRSFFYEGK